MTDEVMVWPTPTTDSTTERTGRYAQGGLPLTAAVSMWDTPSVADVTGGRTSRSGDRKDELLLNSMAAKVAKDSSVSARPTPTSLSFADSHQPGNCYSHNQIMALAANLPTWPTPALTDSKHHDGVTLNDAIILYSPPAPETATDGDGSPSTDPTSSRLSLNPRFVEWLMAWPHGWTNFECSEMEFTLWLVGMRSALWSLPWRAEEAQAQLSLFD